MSPDYALSVQDEAWKPAMTVTNWALVERLQTAGLRGAFLAVHSGLSRKADPVCTQGAPLLRVHIIAEFHRLYRACWTPRTAGPGGSA